MELVDRDGRCWKVLAVVDLGVTRSFWERVFRFLMRQSLHRIEQKLIQLQPLSLPQIRARVCASIQANSDDWRDDEAIAGEVDPPRDEQEMLDELQAAARNAETVVQLINALYDEDLAE